jgi:hypothetical protein
LEVNTAAIAEFSSFRIYGLNSFIRKFCYNYHLHFFKIIVASAQFLLDILCLLPLMFEEANLIISLSLGSKLEKPQTSWTRRHLTDFIAHKLVTDMYAVHQILEVTWGPCSQPSQRPTLKAPKIVKPTSSTTHPNCSRPDLTRYLNPKR